MNRKKWNRITSDIDSNIEVRQIPEGYQMHVLDIDLTGMQLRCDQGIEFIELKQIIFTNISIAKKTPFEASCFVKYIKHNGMPFVDFSVEFLDLRDESYWSVNNYIEEKSLGVFKEPAFA